MSRILTVLAWGVVGLLGFFALMRLVAWDAIEPFIVVNALTMVVYLPAWVVGIGAALRRRWLLAGAAAIIVAAQLAYAAPELLAATPVPEWARGAPTLRLFDANVGRSEEFRPGYSTAIERYRPDLLAFEEFTPGSLKYLEKSGVLSRFPYRCVAPHYGPTGFLVASRRVMRGCRVHTVLWDGKRTPYMVSATIYFDGTSIRLRVVHTLAPLPRFWHEWVSALRAVDETVHVGPTRRMLMIGDFNATWNNHDFAELLADGLTDAAAARGNAFDMTWPNGAIVPPFVRIDHVLTGSGLTVTEIATHTGFGSDHHYLTTTVAVRT